MITQLQDRMRKRMRALDENVDAGFTLIELLVVIAILGILAAIVVFSVAGINDKGQGAACKTDYVTIQTAEEAYFAENNSTYANMNAAADDLTGKFLSTPSKWYTATAVNTNGTWTYHIDLIAGAPCLNPPA